MPKFKTLLPVFVNDRLVPAGEIIEIDGGPPEYLEPVSKGLAKKGKASDSAEDSEGGDAAAGTE